MRKVYVEIKVKAIINIEEGIELDEVISEMDYNLTSQTEGAEIIDTQILEHEIMDSK